MGADEVEVGATEAQGVGATSLELSDDILVDESGVDHSDDAERLGIGDAASAYHLALDAQLGSELSG